MENAESIVEIKIDERYLKKVSKNLLEFSEFVSDNAKKIIDPKADIFDRYMALNRMEAMLEGAGLAMKVVKSGFAAGHNLNHPMLQTERSKECEWDKIKIEEDDFFTTEQQEKKREFMSMMGGAIVSAIKEAMSDSSEETPEKTPEH